MKAIRQSCGVPNDPSTIDQNQQLRVKIPKLNEADTIVPGTVRLAFTIKLDSKDPNRTVCNNLGRAIVEKLVILAGNIPELLSIDDYNVFATYCDLWKPYNESP